MHQISSIELCFLCIIVCTDGKLLNCWTLYITCITSCIQVITFHCSLVQPNISLFTIFTSLFSHLFIFRSFCSFSLKPVDPHKCMVRLFACIGQTVPKKTSPNRTFLAHTLVLPTTTGSRRVIIDVYVPPPRCHHRSPDPAAMFERERERARCACLRVYDRAVVALRKGMLPVEARSAQVLR